MQYFKVPGTMQDHPCYKPNKPRTPNGYYLIANELLTRAECRTINAPTDKLIPVTVKKSKTYKCFGARFESER